VKKISEEEASRVIQKLSNTQALTALETEYDEILIRLWLSLNTEAFNRMIATMLESDNSEISFRSFTSECRGVTIEMTLPSFADLNQIGQLTYNPYQVSRIQFDPSIKEVGAEELSLQILTAFQQAAIDGFLKWLRFCLLSHDLWEDKCKKEAKDIVGQSNRVQFQALQSTECFEPSREKRLRKILRILENHKSVLYGNVPAVWTKGLARFIREHPQLVSQAEKSNFKELIKVLEEGEAVQFSSLEPGTRKIPFI
jgi:hypothetical protein